MQNQRPSSSTKRGERLDRGAVAALGLYAAGVTAAHLLGWRMVVPYSMLHLLPADLLADRLGESLLHLHSQPPLLNLLLGLVLKVEKATSIPPEASLLALHLLLGGAVVILLHRLTHHLGLGPWARWTVLGLVLVDPAFHYYLLGFFYPLHETFFLMVMAVLVYRFLAGSTRSRIVTYTGLCLAAAALVYTRSLFHPLWALAVLLAVAVAGARLRGVRWRPLAAAWAVTALILFAWPLKNHLLFGSFSYSSWQGYNLSQGFPIHRGSLHPMFVFGDSPEQRRLRRNALERVPDRFRGVPALTRPDKGLGVPQWNHHAILEDSRDQARRAFAAVRERPELVWRTAVRNYLRSYTISASRQPRTGELLDRAPGPLDTAWARLYETVVWQFFGVNSRRGSISGFAVLFPLVLLLTAVQLRRRCRRCRRSRRDPAAGTVAFLLASILWVLAMVLLVDGDEANRMRLSTQPFIFLCAAWSLDRGGRKSRGFGDGSAGLSF